MRIMVFDVPAENGGALSVLNDFYYEYKKDLNNDYIFVVSKPELEETKNIKVLRFPWIKKSWIHRLYFDNFIAPKLIGKYGVDKVLSLQNIIVPHSKIYQTVYVHNALSLSAHHFSIFEDRLLWVYQNILSRSVFKSIRNANKVIVQTEWMKKKCIDKLNVEAMKIDVLPPKIDIEVKKLFSETRESLSTFFYPASGVIFKNHNIIIDACIKLNEQGIYDYSVIFTLFGNENKHIAQLYEKVKMYELPVKFIGNLSRDAVFDYYSRSILIFPSYIETVGLPLIEAKMHKTPIIVSDCLFSYETLDGYEKVKYFNPFSIEDLFGNMKNIIKGNKIKKDGVYGTDY